VWVGQAVRRPISPALRVDDRGQAMTDWVEGDAVAAALDCLKCAEFLAGFDVPDHAAGQELLL
jgi:hypothetical protein